MLASVEQPKTSLKPINISHYITLTFDFEKFIFKFWIQDRFISTFIPSQITLVYFEYFDKQNIMNLIFFYCVLNFRRFESVKLMFLSNQVIFNISTPFNLITMNNYNDMI